MKSKMFTRFLKMFLTLMMAVTILPMNVYANTENEQLPDTSEEIVEEVNVEEESKEEVTPDEGEQEVVPESGDEVVEGEETSEEDVEVTPPTDEVIDVNQTPADEQDEVTPPENPDTTDDETDNPVVEDPVENPDDTVVDETVEGEEIPVVEDQTTGENDELNNENEADQGSAISALCGTDNSYALMIAGDELEDPYGTSTLATGETIYVLAGSDFQPTDGSNTTGVNLLNQILDKVDDKYTTMNGFLFAGDYDYSYSASQSGKEALQTAVQAIYGTSMDEVYVQGNHDVDSLVGSVLSSSGENDTENYGVFVINEKDYMWYNDDETTIKNTAANLETYLNAKRNSEYTKPIFVISHLPLHYCMRTQVGGGDGKHANYIFDVLNEAGAAGLNIIFMFGHNHSHGWDDPYGGAAIFLKKGDSINIAQNSTTNYNVETINFTYMNAGYVSYYRNVNSGAETDLSMTVFAITDDTVTIERYTADGLHNLKSAGVANTHASTGKSVDGSCSTNHGGTETYSSDTSVVASGYTVTLNKTITAPDSGTTPTPTPTPGVVTSIERVYNLEQGAPYIIVSERGGTVLTGTSTSYTKDGTTFETLLLNGTASVDTTDLWYYNGTNLIYGNSDNTSAYLLMSTDNAYLGEAHEYRMVDNVYLNDDGTTFTLMRTDDGLYLNQYGGSSSIAAAPYTSDGNADSGSKWQFYKVIKESGPDTKENVTLSANGVSVTAPGITALNVTVDTTNSDVELYSAYASYDINPVDYTQGDEATVEITVNSSFNSNKPVQVIDNGTVIAEVEIVDGTVTFMTNHFSVYALGQTRETLGTSGGDWVIITSPTDGKTTYTYTLDTDGINENGNYLVVNTSSTGTGHALTNNGLNSAGDTTVTIKTVQNKKVIEVTDNSKINWVFSGTSSGTVKNSTRYIYLGSNILSTNQRTLYFNNQSNGAYRIYKTDSERYLRYSNGWKSTSTATNIYLYLLTDENTTGGTAGLYGKVSGNLTYNVSIGTSAEDALAKVKEGITIYYTNDNTSTNGTVYADDADGMTWSLDSSYDGVTPGEYAVTIAYNGVALGVAKVVVPDREIDTITVEPAEGTVTKGVGVTTETGANVVISYKDGGQPTFVPVTVGMLKKADGTQATTLEKGDYTSLKVVYNGQIVSESFTLHVVGKAGNNYPEYPNEGAVKVSKTATGIDFQSSGIAQVEISASGVPVEKGADVVVVIDTSSSMKNNYVGNTGKTRIEVLSESLEQMLLQFQKSNSVGLNPDIDIAIIDFNGYFPTSAGDFDKISYTNSYRDNADMARLFTGENAKDEYIKNVGLAATDFVDVTTLSAKTIAGYFTNDSCASGTNYDGALENAYKLLAAKKSANTEERDQYVIFLSDGAPFRYNGMNNGSTKSTYGPWSQWLTGAWTDAEDFYADHSNDTDYAYFYNGDGNIHPHRYAEAIKGSVASQYDVITRNAKDNTPSYIESVPGLGATIYSIGFGLADDGSDSEGGKVSVATQQELIQVISTGEGYNYPNVQSAEELTTAFTQIVQAINYAATKARFVDQMGDSYNLQMSVSNYSVVNGTTITDKSITPKIEIISYDIYTRQDYLNETITEDKIGDRKGTYTILETVTFNADGTEAYSDQINGGSTNILADGTQIGYVKGVIYAKTFLYNTTPTGVSVDGVSIPTDTESDGTTTGTTNVLPSETFYWKMGTVQTSELAMRYYVYLEGSMEGTTEGGSYPTNEFATLYYDNYLENSCKKDTVSPVMAWKEANVSYAFYLVDENGKIIVNQTTGQTGSFANKIAVTSPVVYETVLLNNDEEVSSIDIASLGVLPEGYTLYDCEGTNGATYTVTINSNTTGSWEITTVKDVATTYVMQYDSEDPSAYSNDLTHNTVGDDYTHTVVWFAVLWKVQALPDSVVIDYGLPVDISVLNNDMFGDNGKLVGVGAYSDSLNLDGYDTSLASGFGTKYTGTYGKAEANTATGKVRYTPSNMQMNGYDKFAYAVNYTGNDNAGYYYDTVTVIPATTIYYEDTFGNDQIVLSTETKIGSSWVVDYESSWKKIVDKEYNVTQSEDRPGQYSLPSIDANNVYGYDGAYSNSSTYSLGSASKVNVYSGHRAKAKFSFYGTGFDLISLTSNTTGTITVKITNESGASVKNASVDTYYGYTQDANGEWVLSKNSPNALYQVPVIKVEGLEYGFYNVEIMAAYGALFDHNGNGNYDFYLDAIRIYDPANDGNGNDIIKDAYLADGEAWPMYHELRNMLIDANTFNSLDKDLDGNEETTEGLVFIDSNDATNEVTDYTNFGPNNEVYLASGQAISFILNNVSDAKIAQLAFKSVGGSTSYKIYDAEIQTVKTAKNNQLNTATDMYSDITSLIGKTIVIINTGDNILSITNLKVTYEKDPTAAAPVMFMVRRSAVNLALASLEPVVEEEVETPDVSNPEIDTPEINNPEVDPDTPVVEPETPNTGNTETTTPETGNNNSGTEENTPSTGTTSPEAPEGGVSNEGKPSTDNTVESEEADTETEVTPENGTTEDEETVTPDTPVEETPETEVEEQLGFFASLIKMIVDFFVSMFSWLIGLVA